MSETMENRPFLVKMMSWIATIAFLVLLLFIVYYAANYEPPEEVLWVIRNLIR